MFIHRKSNCNFKYIYYNIIFVISNKEWLSNLKFINIKIMSLKLCSLSILTIIYTIYGIFQLLLI